jgi:hypothetical protein
VTVLFADVKGAMEPAEQLDPEEWSQIMNRFFQILSKRVDRPCRNRIQVTTNLSFTISYGSEGARLIHGQKEHTVFAECGQLLNLVFGNSENSTPTRTPTRTPTHIPDFPFE